jgi:hypothetical protein
MRIWLVLVVACAGAGCKTDETMYPIITGGGGGGLGGIHDAAVALDGNDGGAQITGKVCLIADARDLVTCSTANASGLSVQLGTRSATTTATGAFVIAAPQGSNLEWQVSGSTVVTTAMSFSASTTIPVLLATTYTDLEGVNGVLEVQGEGAILARVVQAGAAVAQARGATMPVGANNIFYDGNDISQWNAGSSTGPHGVVWAPNIPVGGATLTVTPMTGSAQLVTGIPIIDRGITIVIAELP